MMLSVLVDVNLTERAVFTYRETDAPRRTREVPSILDRRRRDAAPTVDLYGLKSPGEKLG